MTFLPIVDRQLRESSRRPATYRMRSLLALAALAIWFFLLIAGTGSGIRKGMMLFIAIGVLALGFCLVAGIFLTADCLSEEKREGTLGLLFLTELKGYDVVFGKLVATSLHSIYGLLAVLPLLALPLLMGRRHFRRILARHIRFAADAVSDALHRHTRVCLQS